MGVYTGSWRASIEAHICAADTPDYYEMMNGATRESQV